MGRDTLIGRWIKGYENVYSVTEFGDVYSYKFNRVLKLKPLKLTKGYQGVCLHLNNKAKTAKIHRLVAQAYLPDYSESLTVNHIDYDKKNNNISNLEMLTNEDNIRYGSPDRKYVTGENHGKTKINQAQCDSIRAKRDCGERIIDLATEFNLHRTTIHNILKRKTWK